MFREGVFIGCSAAMRDSLIYFSRMILDKDRLNRINSKTEKMNETRVISTWGMAVLVIVFMMAIYGHPDSGEVRSDKSKLEEMELLKTHPGGYELLMASTDENE
jgi:hypothetical protein